MSRRNRLVVAVVGVVLLAGLGGSHGAPKDDIMELYGVFVDAVEQVEANYVRSVPRKQLLESALAAPVPDCPRITSAKASSTASKPWATRP